MVLMAEAAQAYIDLPRIDRLTLEPLDSSLKHQFLTKKASIFLRVL